MYDYGIQEGTKKFMSSKRSREATNHASMSDTPTYIVPHEVYCACSNCSTIYQESTVHVRAALQYASSTKLSLMSFVIMDLRWVILPWHAGYVLYEL